MYVFDEVPAWSGSDYAKIGKRPKWFASDPGLVANLPGWDEQEAYYDSDMSGKLMENWVYHGISSLRSLSPGLEVSQHRDSNRREVDFIVENPKGDILGVEVKAGAMSSDDFSHLKWFAANCAKRKFTGVVLYTGEDILPFGKNLFAVPMACLAQ